MTKKIGLYRCKTDNGTQWRVRWFGKYNPNTGKPKRYSKTFVKKKDAERFQQAKKDELKQGTLRDPSTETLKSYAEQWLIIKIKIDDLRPATVQLYRQTFDRLYNYFGAEQILRTIDRQAAKVFLADLKPLNPTKKKLSNWSRHRIWRNCITLFGEAIEDGKISKNPFSKIMRGTKLEPAKWYLLEPGEFHKLLDVTLKLQEKILYALTYTAGLRESEALALYWTNIDFDRGRVWIEDRPESTDYPPFNAKTQSSNRTVPLPKLTLDLLTQLQLQSPDNMPFVLMDKRGCQRICIKWQKCQEQGRPWLNQYWSNNIMRNFRRRLLWAGIETGGKELTVHVLRKCCAQQWQDTLPENVAKSFLGHSKSGVTEKHYSTVTDEHYTMAQRAMDKWLEKAGGKKTDLKLTFSGDSRANQDVA